MILTGQAISEEVKNGNIRISPFNSDNINPNSYNYHLGNVFIEITSANVIDPRKEYEFPSSVIPEDGLVIQPGSLYLCNTLESIGSEKFVISLIGKSSIGRLGLFVQLSANIGHQNETHQWTLELKCCKPIKIYPNMIIGQVTFWETKGLYYSFDGYFSKFHLPTTARKI